MRCYRFFVLQTLIAFMIKSEGKILVTYIKKNPLYKEAATGCFLYLKGVLKNFTKFTRKSLFCSLFFNNVTVHLLETASMNNFIDWISEIIINDYLILQSRTNEQQPVNLTKIFFREKYISIQKSFKAEDFKAKFLFFVFCCYFFSSVLYFYN